MQILVFFLFSWVYFATASPWHSNQSTPCKLEGQPIHPTSCQSVRQDPTSTSLSAQEDSPSSLLNDAIQWASGLWACTTQWGTTNIESAKSCVLQMIDLVQDTDGASTVQAVVGPCHCGAFFGDKMNVPGLPRSVLTSVMENLDTLGIPRTGYVGEAGAGKHPNNRFGIAIHCNNDRWVADKLAQFSGGATGISQSYGAQWYGAVARPSA